MSIIKIFDDSLSSDNNIREPISKRHVREISGNEAINESLENIILTNFGELLFGFMGFGTNVITEVFSNVSSRSTESIKSKVITAITKWEPRVIVDQSNVRVVIDDENHTFNLSVPYVIKSSGELATFKRILSL